MTQKQKIMTFVLAAVLIISVIAVIGGDPDAYQDNLDVIKQAFNYEAQPDLCYDWSSCDITLCGLQFYVHPEGLVSIGYYDSYQCGFEDPGYFTCHG